MSKRYRGTCGVCNKRLMVKADGTLGDHQSGDRGYCYGMGAPPLEVSFDGLKQAVKKAEKEAGRLTDRVANPADHWRADTLESMAAERDTLYELVASLQLKIRSWKSGDLEEVEPAAKRQSFGEGTCCVCNRVFKLKKDGRLRSHNYHPETIVSYLSCAGEDLRPLEMTNEDCQVAMKKLESRVGWAIKKLNTINIDDFDRERVQIDQRVHLRYSENCRRNYELWTLEIPTPRDPLPPVTDKPAEKPEQPISNPTVVEVKRPSGCMAAVILVFLMPLAGFYTMR